MKFSILINLDRFDPNEDMGAVLRRCLELVQIADRGGFDIAWTAEHHTLEVTIAPNPLLLLTYWGQHTERIRLGTAVLSAPYWHPIRLAGEIAMADLLLDGRLELGFGLGSYQRTPSPVMLRALLLHFGHNASPTYSICTTTSPDGRPKPPQLGASAPSCLNSTSRTSHGAFMPNSRRYKRKPII